MIREQMRKAALLRSLHKGPDVLVLPNAWDAASARLIEAEGFAAIATTSSGCAAVLGYRDGEKIPPGEMLFLAGKIAHAVNVPVTADLEAGYGDAARTAQSAIDAGLAGMNLEDMADGAFLPLPDQLGRIRAVREAAGSDFFINARTDIFLAKDGDPATRFARSVERLNAFFDVGADCGFVPGVSDAETIGRLAGAVRGPLNILAVAGSPSIAEMKKLGVARVSFGGGPARVALGAMLRFARVLKATGTFDALSHEAISWTQVFPPS